MTAYEFHCRDDGVFDLRLPMGTAGDVARCPTCGRESRRTFSPPMVAHPDRRLVRALDRIGRSSDEPEVVTNLPASTRRPRTAPPAPALRRLPRP